MISINYRDGRPIYEQVRDGLRQLIIAGALPGGSRMPSVRELAASLTINPNTIQRAYRELEEEGYTVSVPGKGSFVCEQSDAAAMRKEELKASYQALLSEMKQLGAGEEELAVIFREVYGND